MEKDVLLVLSIWPCNGKNVFRTLLSALESLDTTEGNGGQ